MWTAGLKKDPGIPNLFPFKEQLLKQLEERRQQAQSQREREKQLRQQESKKKKKSLQGLQNDAQRRAREFEKKVGSHLIRIPVLSLSLSLPLSPSLPPSLPLSLLQPASCAVISARRRPLFIRQPSLSQSLPS